jgi:hypothetical protein
LLCIMRQVFQQRSQYLFYCAPARAALPFQRFGDQSPDRFDSAGEITKSSRGKAATSHPALNAVAALLAGIGFSRDHKDARPGSRTGSLGRSALSGRAAILESSPNVLIPQLRPMLQSGLGRGNYMPSPEGGRDHAGIARAMPHSKANDSRPGRTTGQTGAGSLAVMASIIGHPEKRKTAPHLCRDAIVKDAGSEA